MNALYIFHERNILPFGSSWSEQFIWFVEAYSIYCSELKRERDRQREYATES